MGSLADARAQRSSASYSDRPAGWISRPTRLGGRSPNSEPLLTAIAPVSLLFLSSPDTCVRPVQNALDSNFHMTPMRESRSSALCQFLSRNRGIGTESTDIFLTSSVFYFIIFTLPKCNLRTFSPLNPL